MYESHRHSSIPLAFAPSPLQHQDFAISFSANPFANGKRYILKIAMLLPRRSLLFAPLALAAQPPADLRFEARTRILRAPDGQPTPVDLPAACPPARAAAILCDVWDRHWCRGANERVAAMLPRLIETTGALRRRGVQIIHAPSDTMDFYRDTPQRRAILALPAATPPPLKPWPDPPLPIDDSDEGCDTPGDLPKKTYTRQHPAIPIEAADFISDNGNEIYNALHARRATHLFIMGVHTNMCILNRSFAIKRMTRWGFRCFLVRDLTDAMYNPARAPFVSHDRGTELVIEYIEQHWCPSTTSESLMNA
ncbi:MAG: isochorismatase [Bryobacteraceae bacterium]|nr:isochorismatase [Bryobacteraceae bacterium]